MQERIAKGGGSRAEAAGRRGRRRPASAGEKAGWPGAPPNRACLPAIPTGRGLGGAAAGGYTRAYLEVGPPAGHPAHDDVGRGHGPGGREAEAHVAGGPHLEAEGKPAAPLAPAQPVLALGVQQRAVREGPARAPRRGAGEQPPQQEQRPAAHPQARPAHWHLGSRRLERGGRTRSGGASKRPGTAPRPARREGPQSLPLPFRPGGPGLSPADSIRDPPFRSIHLPPPAPDLVPKVGFSGERSDWRPGRGEEEAEAEDRGSTEKERGEC